MKTRRTPHFSPAELGTERQWKRIFKMLMEKDFQVRIRYPAKLPIQGPGQIKDTCRYTKTKKVYFSCTLSQEVI